MALRKEFATPHGITANYITIKHLHIERDNTWAIFSLYLDKVAHNENMSPFLNLECHLPFHPDMCLSMAYSYAKEFGSLKDFSLLAKLQNAEDVFEEGQQITLVPDSIKPAPKEEVVEVVGEPI